MNRRLLKPLAWRAVLCGAVVVAGAAASAVAVASAAPTAAVADVRGEDAPAQAAGETWRLALIVATALALAGGFHAGGRLLLSWRRARQAAPSTAAVSDERMASVLRAGVSRAVARSWLPASVGARNGADDAGAQRPFAGKTVLVADDDFDVAQVLTMRFELLGCSVVRTSDALFALFGAHKLQPDLAVLDISMPTGNGLAVCEMIRSDRRLAAVPVIIYSAFLSEPKRRRCRELGAVYVAKQPQSWQRIEKLARRLLGIPLAPATPPAETTLQPAETTAPPTATTTPPTESTPAARPPIDEADAPAVSEPIGEPRPDAEPRAGGESRGQDDSPTRPAPSADPPADAGAARRVLIIDDEPAISRALAKRLRPYGVDVASAYSGMQGYWMALDARPEAIICDMRMPEGQGSYICGRLKNHPLTRDIPIIMLTAQDHPGLKRELLNIGAAAYLHKPLVFKDLLEELGRHIPLNDTKAEACAV